MFSRSYKAFLSGNIFLFFRTQFLETLHKFCYNTVFLASPTLMPLLSEWETFLFSRLKLPEFDLPSGAGKVGNYMSSWKHAYTVLKPGGNAGLRTLLPLTLLAQVHKYYSKQIYFSHSFPAHPAHPIISIFYFLFSLNSCSWAYDYVSFIKSLYLAKPEVLCN